MGGVQDRKSGKLLHRKEMWPKLWKRAGLFEGVNGEWMQAEGRVLQSHHDINMSDLNPPNRWGKNPWGLSLMTSRLHSYDICHQILLVTFNQWWIIIGCITEKAREFQKKHLLLLYWLCQSLRLCGSQWTVENSERGENTRPPDLPPEKSVCRSRSNS